MKTVAFFGFVFISCLIDWMSFITLEDISSIASNFGSIFLLLYFGQFSNEINVLFPILFHTSSVIWGVNGASNKQMVSNENLYVLLEIFPPYFNKDDVCSIINDMAILK